MLFIMTSRRLKYKVQRRPVTYTSLILFDIDDDLLHTTEAEGCREQVLIGFLPCACLSGEKVYVEDIKEIYVRKSFKMPMSIGKKAG